MKPPKTLVFYIVFWLIVFIGNTIYTFIDFDQYVMAFMEPIKEAKIEMSEETVRTIFLYTTVFISLFLIGFFFLLYKGVKAARYIYLAISITGLPFSLFGLLQFAAMSGFERFQSLLSLVMSFLAIYILFREDVKLYFMYDSSTAASETQEDNIDNIEEKLS